VGEQAAPLAASRDRHRLARKGLRTWPVLLLLACLTFVACSSAPGPIVITLDQGAGATPASVRVSGLSGDELTALRTAVWREEGWQALMTVTVAGDAIPVVGRYVASREALEFHPRFPFDPGRSYLVRFDPRRLPAPRIADAVETTVALPRREPTAPTTVTAVTPSSDVWPSNLLRFYVHFSAPMSRTEGVEFVRLIDDAGREVSDALLPSAIDFWNGDRTRYTVFFDPGRVKRGILSNRTLGRALQPGRQYEVVVDVAWRDGEGRALAKEYRRSFRAGPPVEQALSLTDWRLAVPRAGTTDALVVTFPHPLDEGLLHRAVAVAPSGRDPLEGGVLIGRGETEWRFAPVRPWRSGSHDLLVLSILEDPSGNRLGRAFEVDPSQGEDEPPPPEQFTLPFVVR
jgi:hypothetical protein